VRTNIIDRVEAVLAMKNGHQLSVHLDGFRFAERDLCAPANSRKFAHSMLRSSRQML
jgi:hypothetical protein